MPEMLPTIHCERNENSRLPSYNIRISNLRIDDISIIYLIKLFDEVTSIQDLIFERCIIFTAAASELKNNFQDKAKELFLIQCHISVEGANSLIYIAPKWAISELTTYIHDAQLKVRDALISSTNDNLCEFFHEIDSVVKLIGHDLNTA